MDPHTRIRANRGIHLSAFYGSMVGLGGSVGLFVGLITWRLYPTPDGINTAVELGLVFGLFVGSVAGLLSGGFACIEHAFLRFLLWRSGCLPWHLTRFLDETTRHILMQKVGGGYQFLHRVFLDYFADEETYLPASRKPPKDSPSL